MAIGRITIDQISFVRPSHRFLVRLAEENSSLCPLVPLINSLSERFRRNRFVNTTRSRHISIALPEPHNATIATAAEEEQVCTIGPSIVGCLDFFVSLHFVPGLLHPCQRSRYQSFKRSGASCRVCQISMSGRKLSDLNVPLKPKTGLSGPPATFSASSEKSNVGRLGSFFYFFRSTTHSQCESPSSMFLVSLKVKFGFRLSAAPSPHL
jgi:hypothetical protein